MKCSSRYNRCLIKQFYLSFIPKSIFFSFFCLSMYGTYILTITHIIKEYNEEDEIYNLYFFSLEQGNSSSPEADLRLSHPRPGLPPHLSGYPLYPVTGK